MDFLFRQFSECKTIPSRHGACELWQLAIGLSISESVIWSLLLYAVRRMLSIAIMTFALSFLHSAKFRFRFVSQRHRRLWSLLRLWNLLDAYANWYLNCCVWHVECVAVAAALNSLFFDRFAHAAHSKTHANTNAPYDVSTSPCWVLTSADEALAKWTRAAAEIMMNYLPMEVIQRVVVHGERARRLTDDRLNRLLGTCHSTSPWSSRIFAVLFSFALLY